MSTGISKLRLAIVNATAGGLSGGYRKYLSELLPILKEDPRIAELSVWYPEAVGEKVDIRDEITRTWPGNALFVAPEILRVESRRRRVNVFFYPTQRMFYGLTGPSVSMVRNMEPLARCWSRRTPSGLVRNVLRRHFARRAARRSEGVIAVSSYVARFVRERWGVPEERLATIYHGVSEPRSNLSPPAFPWVRELSDRFVFSAGSFVPYRGFEDIIEAAELLNSAEISFVLAGDENRDSDGYASQLRRLVAARKVKRVHFVGKLDADEMAWCYEHCAAYIATSRVEACPNTALEALSCGCLIVSSDAEPHPEFFQENATYYPCGSAPKLAERISEVLSLGRELKEARMAGAKQRAGQFTWQNTADKTIAFLMQIADQSATAGR